MVKKGEQSEIAGLQVPDKMFFKIRDVARIADVKPHVLRYWESEFSSLSPQKNKNGQRVYTRKDVDMVLEIKNLLHNEKYSIAGARQHLKKKRGERRKGGAVEAIREARKDLADLLKILDEERP